MSVSPTAGSMYKNYRCIVKHHSCFHLSVFIRLRRDRERQEQLARERLARRKRRGKPEDEEDEDEPDPEKGFNIIAY